MKLSRLKLTNFRNYKERAFEFDAPTTVLVGPNAVGKTNVLESIYLLATGDSFRAQKIEEMVRWEQEVGHVVGEIADEIPRLSGGSNTARSAWDDKSDLKSLSDLSNKRVKLQVTLTRGEVQGKRVQKRRFLVNGLGRRKLNFVGNFAAVLFRPEDLRLVGGSPSRRRNYMDVVISQVDKDYRRSLMSYEKGLRRRNKLLDLIRDGEVARTALAFWDQLLVKEGTVLTEKRQALVDFYNSMDDLDQKRRLVYNSSVISQKRLEQYANVEVAAGYTLVGPHKDDFVILTSNSKQLTINKRGKDLAVYGSRGEQRMGVLWLKVAELQFIEDKIGQRPVLLLDDIFSELDDKHDALVIGLLGEQQIILTTTDEDGRFGGLNEIDVVRL